VACAAGAAGASPPARSGDRSGRQARGRGSPYATGLKENLRPSKIATSSGPTRIRSWKAWRSLRTPLVPNAAFIGIKEAFTEVSAVHRALEEMREADALGSTQIEVVLGPDLYLFGEETGLEEVIEDRPPLPRIARPFMLGLFATPPRTTPPS